MPIKATAEAQRQATERPGGIGPESRRARLTPIKPPRTRNRAQRNAEAESERNRLAAANSDQQLKQAVQDREELRAKLLQQFNLIFATRDTARGLIVNLSDVLFDTGKSTLRPDSAREARQNIRNRSCLPGS